MLSSHHHLGINHNVDWKDYSAKRSINHVHDVTAEDATEDSEDHQTEQQCKKDAVTHREIDLGLESKDGQAQNHQCGYPNSCKRKYG